MAEEQKATKRQVALRMAGAETGGAAELVAVLERITQSGTITVPGVAELKAWLEANQHSDLPAIEFLRTTLEQTSAEEYTALYKAVERVLPPELREKAKARRVAADLLEKTTQREQKAALRDRAREERERNRRIYVANFMVAGTSYEGRSAAIEAYLSPDQTVYLVRDPLNAHDKNAIEVRLANGRNIGYVPRDAAEGMAPVLDSGCKQVACCTTILTGGNRPIPVVDVRLYRPDATVPGAIDSGGVLAPSSALPAWSGWTGAARRSTKADKQPITSQPSVKTAVSSSGCLIVMAAGLLVVFLVALLVQ